MYFWISYIKHKYSFDNSSQNSQKLYYIEKTSQQNATQAALSSCKGFFRIKTSFIKWIHLSKSASTLAHVFGLLKDLVIRIWAKEEFLSNGSMKLIKHGTFNHQWSSQVPEHWTRPLRPPPGYAYVSHHAKKGTGV